MTTTTETHTPPAYAVTRYDKVNTILELLEKLTNCPDGDVRFVVELAEWNTETEAEALLELKDPKDLFYYSGAFFTDEELRLTIDGNTGTLTKPNQRFSIHFVPPVYETYRSTSQLFRQGRFHIVIKARNKKLPKRCRYLPTPRIVKAKPEQLGFDFEAVK